MALIQFEKKDDFKVFEIILKGGCQVGVFRNYVYSVGEEYLKLFREAGIRFKEIT
ncbi:unnamed protein product [marine sediment metagenome]|uniref:Uncharacterized protein n=1 Tax=marine sediment metagenome TaxID=412755 RepID=X1EC44_9ZZZZ